MSLVICFHWESPQESRLPRFFPTSLRRPAGLREGGRGDGEAKGTRGPGSGNALAPSSRLRALQQPLLGVLGLKTWVWAWAKGQGRSVAPFPLPPSRSLCCPSPRPRGAQKSPPRSPGATATVCKDGDGVGHSSRHLVPSSGTWQKKGGGGLGRQRPRGNKCPQRPLSGILHDVAEKLLPQERQLVGGGADGRVLELDRGEGCTTLWM